MANWVSEKPVKQTKKALWVSETGKISNCSPKLTNKIGFDTLSTDMSTLSETVEGIYKGWQSKKTMDSTKPQVESMYNRLKAFQSYNKQFGDGSVDVSEQINAYKSVLDDWDEIAKGYGKYKNADEYDEALKNAEEKLKTDELLRTANTVDIETEINDLQKLKKKAEVIYKQWNVRSVGAKGDQKTRVKKARDEEIRNVTGGYTFEELQKLISEKEQFKNKAKWAQNGVVLSSVSNKDSKNYDKNFKKYVSSGVESTLGEVGDLTTMSGIRAVPEYTNIQIAFLAMKEHYGKTKLEGPLENTFGDRLDTYRFMKDNEFELLAYYFGKDKETGKNQAEEYLYSIEEVLAERRAVEEFKKYKDKTFKEIMYGIPSGLNQYGTGIQNLSNDNEYIPLNYRQQLSGMIREDLKDNGPAWLAGTSLAQGAFDFLNTTSNMAPSILGSAVLNAVLPGTGAVLGAATMGFSASGNAYQEKINLGWSKEDAKKYSIAVGVSEAGLSYALSGIGSLGGKLSGKTIKAISDGVEGALGKFVLTYGGKISSEVLEESLQEILNPVFENLALGYKENDFSDIEWQQVAYSAVMAALSAGLLEFKSSYNDSFKANKNASNNTKFVSSNLRLTTNAVSQPLETYNEEKQSLIKSFLDSVDVKIKNFVQRVKSGDLTFAREKISNVNERVVKDIKNLLGIDVSGYTHNINTNGIQHILTRHGENGKHDSTMSLDEDIARVGWILENYDSVEILKKDEKISYSSEFRDDKDRPAPQIKFVKKIDGYYYVVEAACENKFNKLWVQSAYLTKNKEDVTQAAFADNGQDTNAQSALASPSSNTKVPQKVPGVNNNISNSEQNNTQADPNGPANFMPGEGSEQSQKEKQVVKGFPERRHVNKAEQDFIKRICEKLGVKMKFIHITPELLAEKGYEFEDGLLPDGFYDKDTDTLYIGFTVIDPVKFVFKHELTHFGEGTAQYVKFVEAVKKSKAYKEWLIKRSKLNPDVNSMPAMEAAVRRKYMEARKQEKDFGPAKAESEMIADFVGEYLFNEDGTTIEAILSGLNQKERNAVIQYILDFLSYLKKKLQGENNLIFEISRLEDNFNRMLSEAVQTKKEPSTKNGGDLKFSIVTLDSGKSFVQAARRIITGNSVAEWRSQISEFFNNALKNGPIEIETIEGDVLTISKDTANKARDRNVTKNGVTRKLTDKEFLVKLHAESHIDELAELSTTQKNNIVSDSKNHSFAKDGFTYRTVYFQDFDDSYYKVTLSVGENNGVSTVYNVGKIKADDIPNGNIVSAIGSKADMSSANSRISQSQSTVNNNSMQKSENNSKDNIQFCFARADDMSIVEEAEKEEAKWKAENKSERVIRRKVWDKTGLIRDSSGEWVYEISDDQMKVYLDGDAINPLGDDFKEFLDLGKFKRLTPEKRKRYRELYDKYGPPWKRKFKLENFIKHDELFAKYPQLKDYDVHICFLGRNEYGSFNPETKTININWELVEEAKQLKEEAEDWLDLEFSDIKVREVLVHEIQHAIQDIDQRENGASIQYWKNRLDSGKMPINPKTKKPYTPEEAYRLTKGEYEARQSEERLLKKEGARKEKVPDFGWGKTLSAEKSEAAGNLKFSVPTNSEYMSAVNENDTEKLQQMVDNKARAEGYTERLYHQTGADFTEFNTDNPKAGKYDWELPTGTFLKPSNDDIGLEGKKQMELYAKLQNPLEFEDRIDAQRFWRENIPGYDKAADDIIKVDIEYGDKLNSAASKSRRYLKEWKQNNPDSNNRDIYKDSEYLRLKDIEDSISNEWESQVNELSLIAKKLVDDYISKTDYDGIIVEKDQDGIKHLTKTYIVFDANQLKDAAPVTYDDNGNVISLSQRFDSEQSDIRFSVPIINQNFTEAMNSLNQELQNGKISMDEFKSKVDILFKEAGETHGTIKKGETVTGKENFDNPVPKSVDGNTKIRQYTRTILEGGQLTEEMLSVTKQMILSGELSYTPTTNKKNQAYADKIIESGHAEDRWNKIANCEEMPNGGGIALGETLLKNAVDRKDAVVAAKLIAEITEAGTRIGQSMQALSLLKRMDGIGQLYYVQKAVNTLNNDLQKKYKNEPPIIVINEELALQLAESKTKEDFEITYAAILNDIASQVPATFLDKWNAWRYMAMLFNPTTHIKNFFGNAVFLPAVKIKDIIAYGGEQFIDQSERTKSVIVKKEYKEFAKNDFSNVEDIITSGGKMNPKRSIADNKPIFKTEFLEKLRKFNFDMLEKEDAIFLKLHFQRALGGYLQARGVNLKTISPTVLQSAREYAILEAQKATFRDTSAIANWLAKGSQKNLVGNILIEGTLPFKKTSANVLKRSVEYSPVGIITTVGKSVRDFHSSDFTVSQFIDSLAGNLTGTGIFVMGMWLAASGIIRGGSDGDDEDWFDEMLGKQDYSVEIGGISYTVDWMAPACVPLFMGVSVMEGLRAEDNTTAFANILEGMGEGLSPIIELSMLSGVQGALETIRYSKPEEILPNLIINAAESYALQMLPSLGTKVANLVDPVRRSNYIDKTSPVPEKIQSVANKAAGKIPFASKLKAEYINAWGEKENNGTFVTRLFQNFISPGYLSKVDIDNIDAEIKRLAKATANMSVFPDAAPKYIKFKNVTKHLNRDDYEIYAVAKGQMCADYIKEAIESEEYQKLNDEQKAEVITNLYAFSNAKAKAKLIYSYEELSVMNEGITEELYKGYSDKVKKAIAEEYFLQKLKTVSDRERDGYSAVNYYCQKAKEN